jgi:hypothetical protein
VLRWDARTVCVECPYCLDLHWHSFPFAGRHNPPCSPAGGQYEFVFPLDESRGLVGYEIDKKGAWFVNIGMQASPESGDSHFSDEDEDELADLFRSKMNISADLYADAKELETITAPNGDISKQKAIKSAITHCLNGDVDALGQYLSTSAESNLFLHGTDEVGETTLVAAAQEKATRWWHSS